MYVNAGRSVLLPEEEIVGIFDLDNTTCSQRARDFLNRAQRDGRVRAVGEDLPKSFLLCQGKEGGFTVWLTELTTSALKGRAESGLSDGLIKEKGAYYV